MEAKLVPSASTDASIAAASRPREIGARIPGIDGLRATALLLVMASHTGLGYVIPGRFGVTIFFFLSGYLITTLLRIEHQRSGRIHLGAFYARRAVRILPPLYLTMALVIGLYFAGWMNASLKLNALVFDLLFLTNYSGAANVWATNPIPLWSLDIEEHYYFVFPALFASMASPRFRRLALVLAAICIIVLLIRFATFFTASQLNISYWTHTRIDSIMFGALLALWQNPVLDEHAWCPSPPHVAIAAGVIVLTFAIRAPLFRETVRYSLQGMALFVLFSAAIQSRGIGVRVLNSRPMRFVALLSYTLYLVHFPLLDVTSSLPAPWSVLTAYLLAFSWAGAMYALVERPLANWRKASLRRAASRRAELAPS